MRFEQQAESVAVLRDWEALNEDFFCLSTRLAGEILKKCINYQMKLAVMGDFTGYASKNLGDFIRESNCGRSVFFVSAETEAVEKLAENT